MFSSRGPFSGRQRRGHNQPAEPIAADARPGKDGKTNALFKILSGVLGVGYNDLKQREKQRQRQKRIRFDRTHRRHRDLDKRRLPGSSRCRPQCSGRRDDSLAYSIGATCRLYGPRKYWGNSEGASSMRRELIGPLSPAKHLGRNRL